ncbi:MAG: flagellar basal body rod protein FlgC [Proteobacteria bacterium]|nr:flagellar basal body rod protein FlgC [Pseudomonadota bacterium]
MFNVFAVSASGMEAQRMRMNVIASNLANVETTHTSEGGPYRRKDIVFKADENTFGNLLGSAMKKGENLTGVSVAGIIADSRPLKYAYEPSHPDADTSGYVAYPNVNAVEEMVNMIAASRSYEANSNVFKSSRDMAAKAMELLR